MVCVLCCIVYVCCDVCMGVAVVVCVCVTCVVDVLGYACMWWCVLVCVGCGSGGGVWCNVCGECEV